MREWTIKRVLVHEEGDERLVVTTGLHHLQGNERPYFSTTADLYVGRRQEPEACGCLHKEVIKAFPKLKPLVDIHLADDRGHPMHALANAVYWIEQGHVQHLASHLIIDEAAAQAMIEDFTGEAKRHADEAAEREGDVAPGCDAVWKRAHHAALKQLMQETFDNSLYAMWDQLAKQALQLLTNLPTEE